MSDKIQSESDARTANNAVRHTYRVLSDDEKRQMVCEAHHGIKKFWAGLPGPAAESNAERTGREPRARPSVTAGETAPHTEEHAPMTPTPQPAPTVTDAIAGCDHG